VQFPIRSLDCFFHFSIFELMTITKTDASPVKKNEYSIDALNSDLDGLIDKINHLQTLAADSSEELRNQLGESNARMDVLKLERDSLLSQANKMRESNATEITQIHQERLEVDMDALLRENITIPDYKLRLYWDHLRIKLEPSRSGGVAISLCFPHSTRLCDLRFVLQFAPSDETFMVTDCDPMVIGLADLVTSLNTDTRPGALARFCCRVRSTYTAQYSTDI